MDHIIDLVKSEGGYKLQGRMKFQGLNISIENRAGSIRSGVDVDGNKWSTRFKGAHYGRIIGVDRIGPDGDHVDVFIKVRPDLNQQKVWIINLVKANDSTKSDESKCFLGFDSKEDTMSCFKANYDKAWKKLFGSCIEMDIETFKKKLSVKTNKIIKSIRAVSLGGEMFEVIGFGSYV